MDNHIDLKNIKKDVDCAIKAWKNILENNLSEKILYAYCKGSAIKPWDSQIDYVPILSDLDIHIKLKNDLDSLFSSKDTFAEALGINEEYERKFIEYNPTYLHIPRIQIIILNEFEKELFFIPAQEKDILTILGKPVFDKNASKEFIREIDLRKLQELGPLLEKIPIALLDRTGMDYWSFLRKISWIISPTPVRLLTQEIDDPYKVWGWNRTRIVRELRKRGIQDIPNDYEDYYQEGWILFKSGFTSTKSYRNLILKGIHVLKNAYNMIENTKSQEK